MEFGSYENVKGTKKHHKSTEHVAPASTDGFGSRDDIRSFLPVASDFTDFEAHMHKGQDYKHLDQPDPSKDTAEVQNINYKEIKNVSGPAGSEPKDAVEVNMEASVVSDEVNRAGGFGARYDISSFLPVASDFTDFEAHIRGARDYEDLDEQITRPGLGWSNNTNDIK